MVVNMVFWSAFVKFAFLAHTDAERPTARNVTAAVMECLDITVGIAVAAPTVEYVAFV